MACNQSLTLHSWLFRESLDAHCQKWQMQITCYLGAASCTFATNKKLNTGRLVNLCQSLDSVGSLTRMLQKSVNLLFVLLPLIFGQEEEFFGCCPLKEVQGAWMVDRYGDVNGAGNDDGVDDIRSSV